MAMFTYQLAYWGWVKLEQDEITAEREGGWVCQLLPWAPSLSSD